MAYHSGNLIQHLEQEELLQHQQHKEVQAPNKVVPAGAVPDTGGGPHHQQVEHPPGLGAAVASQGDIQVFPEPGGQGDVPAPPELGDAFGDIGIVEVGQEFKAQHPAKAGGHIGVTGEVEVDLEGKGDHAQPRTQNSELSGAHSLIGLPQHAHIVGNQHLLGHTDHKDLHAGGELLGGGSALVDLIAQVLIFDNRTGDELGEQGNEGTEVDDAALGTGISAVHVDGVAHGLEGIEGDTDGQMDAQHRHEGQAHGLQRTGQEVPVLEEQQQSQVKDDGRGHRQPGSFVIAFVLATLHQHTVGIVDGGGQEHDGHILSLAPVIEEQRRDQQYHVAPLPGHQVIDQQGQSQKIE